MAKHPITVNVERADLEAFHRDLELISAWCRQALTELAKVDRGRAQWPAITRAMCAAATWRGRLSVALREPAEARPLRLLGSNIEQFERPAEVGPAEVDPAEAPRRCRLRPSA